MCILHFLMELNSGANSNTTNFIMQIISDLDCKIVFFLTMHAICYARNVD